MTIHEPMVGRYFEDFEAGDPIKTDYMYWLESTC